MLKLLIKKQFLEIFRAYYYDEKKNKARSKASTILFLFGFVLLMAGLLGGIFTYLSIRLCRPMVAADVAWLYFALMGLLAIFLGTFGSVFNTYASLYLAKDNDLLLSMPIPAQTIMASRLIGVYLMGLMYSGVVSVPMIIVYWMTAGITVQSVVGGIVLALLISVFVLTLSGMLGWIVAKISLKLKNKSMITVLISLIFIAGYYFVYFKAQSIIQDVLLNLAVYGSNIKASAYPVYLFGSVGAGDGKAAVIMTFVVAVLFVLMWILISRSFLKVATSTGKTVQTKYKEIDIRQKSVSKALFGREFCHFTSSANYMLNCGLGVFFMPVLAIAVLWKGKDVFSILGKMFAGTEGGVPLLVTVILCGCMSMILITAPSVSLEGKSLWLVQSLPVTFWQVLREKLRLQLFLTEIPAFICMVCIAFVCPLKMAELLFLILQISSYGFLMAVFGLLLGVKKPVFTWTNEIVPIKQSAPVAITMFAGFGYVILLFAGYVILQGWLLGYIVYISIFIAVNAVAGVPVYIWLKTKANIG